MKSVLALVALVLMVVPHASSLNCHSCRSEVGFLECSHDKIEEQCKNDQSCGKYSYTYGGNDYWQNGCIDTKECSSSEMCLKDSQKDNCVVYCCDTDLCNPATTNVPSGITILLSVYIAFFCLYLVW
ncbi:predicted protein [Nematostella vectensis]|uniref:Uncharacterized protein n=1 Tax=Nematostella vectensis TaxID=45351 RepID=A7SMG5_NEMVE|nr:predicted protein [Nematostella vectensis]|eukprot:XP_001627226.1 predicted protein [Nematostella vectensis]